MSLAESTQYAHSQMVSKISRILATHAGYSQPEVNVITQAALLHDIGKQSVPTEILAKPGALSPREFEIVKTHTQAGYRCIAETLHALSAAILVASQHHERLDGSGYLGLQGDEIAPYARLVAVADVFDALISRRSYKEPWGQRAVCDYIKAQAGIQFDAEITALLLTHMDEIMTLYRQEEKRKL